MTKILEHCNAILWGAPVLVLILGVGLYLSIRTGFPQLTLLGRAFRVFWERLRSEDASSFRALCTALGATVGTGNLVGVAGAICMGGPGAVFWMWICGLLGMGIKYAEVLLALRYRIKTREGYLGGPMYNIVHGLGQKFRPLAVAYCLFGLGASFGVGNGTQVNAVISAANRLLPLFGKEPNQGFQLLMGVLLALFVGILLFGGAKKIGTAAQILVPVAAIAYVALSAGVLMLRWRQIPDAILSIVRGAFAPKAVTGGALGSAFLALRIGCSRGVFTNEAGMGTASIAHASADVSHPAEQGLMGLVEVFLDTIVICTLTALVILVSGVPVPYGTDGGATLTVDAFSRLYGNLAPILISIMLLLFAVATILGWSLYGARCAQFLFGEHSWRWYAIVQTGLVVAASIMDGAVIWQAAEVLNGLMAIPNLITLAALSPEIVRLTKDYKNPTQ